MGSRLPTLKVKQLVAALKRAGYVEGEQRGSHLALVHPERGLTTVHPGDVPRSIVRAVLRELEMTEDKFRKLL